SGAAPGFRKVSTRATRYCAVTIPPNTSGAATTATSRKCPMRAPAVNRTTPARIATSNAIDRFGSRKINPTSGARITRNGSTPFRKVRICSPFFAASIAVQTTTANLASSDGCTVTNPRSTQRRDDPAHQGAERLAQRERRADLSARRGQETRRPVHRREAEHDQHGGEQ